MKKHIFIGGKEFEIEIKNEKGKKIFICNNKKFEVDLIERKIDGKIFAIINGKCIEFLPLKKEKNKNLILVDGKEYEVEIGTKRETFEKEAKNIIYAPMPGIITEIKVNIGQKVKKGEPLVIMESMKMQLEISSPNEAEIEEIYVQKNSSIKKGDKILKIKT